MEPTTRPLSAIPCPTAVRGLPSQERIRSRAYSTQTNLRRPRIDTCEHRTAPIVHSDGAPRIQLQTPGSVLVGGDN